MVTINEVELATKLAERATIDEVLSDPDCEWCNEDNIIEKDDDGSYHLGIQPIFDRWYDYFKESIEECECEYEANNVED